MHQPLTRPDLTADIPAVVVVPDGRQAAVVVTLEYRTHRPLEVHAHFRDIATGAPAQDDGAIGWSFHRDTIAQGAVGGTAGDADVRVGTTAGNLLLHLTGHANSDGIDRCTLRLPLPLVAAFLDRTYTLVPAGAEVVWPGMDADLARLLDGGV